MRYYLYRLKAYRSRSVEVPEARRDFFARLIEKKPSKELRKGYLWHVGNVKRVSSDCLYFAVGRTTKSTLDKYDEGAGDFVTSSDKESPYTHVIVDEENSVIAIAERNKLAGSSRVVANSLVKLLNDDSDSIKYKIRFEIAELYDPQGFIRGIKDAYEVVSFSMGFTEPNPFDVEKDFHEPMERLLFASGGKSGATKIKGPDLDKEVLAELAKSVASTGDEASASIRPAEGLRPVTYRLREGGELVSVNGPSGTENIQIVGILETIKSVYNRIRG